MNITLAALNAAALALGKAAIFLADEWDGETDLTLTYLGDTEGDIAFNANETVATLKLPEEYGPGTVRAYITGADPVATIPLFLATPELRALISPNDSLAIGLPGRREVTYHTLIMFPRELFYDSGTERYTSTLSFTSGGGWKKTVTGVSGAQNLTADEERMLDLSIWMWSGFFERPPVTFRHGTDADVAKDIETATFRGRVPLDELAEAVGEAMVTIGNPVDHSIAIDVA